MNVTDPVKRYVLCELFLGFLADGDGSTLAAQKAGKPFQTFYDWKRDDADFSAKWEHAYSLGTDRMEQEARRRAVEGVDTPVFYKGDLCGVKREYSDNLLTFVMAARDPQRYCPKVRAARILKEEHDAAEARARKLAEEHMAVDREMLAELSKIAAAKTENAAESV